MEAVKPHGAPRTVFAELDITLSAVEDLHRHHFNASVDVPTQRIEEDADVTERIVGLARLSEEERPPLEVTANYVDEKRKEVAIRVTRTNRGNGNPYTMTYVATEKGDVYSLVESDDDRYAVRLGEKEVAKLFDEVRSCRVSSMV